MLERQRRSQMRLDTAAPIVNRTTTMRRTRRLSFNIEANGFVAPRTRRRRRRDPYFITYPPMYDPMQMGHQWGFDFSTNAMPNVYENIFPPFNRLDAGERYEYDTVNSLPPEETCDTTKPHVAHEIGDILLGLDSLLQDKKVEILEEHHDKSNTSENNEDQSSSSQANHHSVLTDVMCEAIDRINNYIGNYFKQQEMQASLNQINQLRGKLPAIQVLQLPVQPLIVQSVPPCPSFDNYPFPENYIQKKSHLERLPWLKERKRKRLSKSTTYVHMQNQGSSTEDLSSRNNLTEIQQTSKKDAGTTMWCPRECCRDHCGALKSQDVYSLGQENEETANSLTSTGYPPPCLKAPPPSIKSDEEGDDHGEYYRPTGESMYLLDSPRTSSYRSSCDYRQGGGNLTYSYMEEEEQVDDDDWYRSASNKLAELEVEQDYFKELEQKMLTTSEDQAHRTDPEPNSENSFVNIIATSNMAVSTTELNAETHRNPTNIVRICKTSSLKQRNNAKGENQRVNSPGIHKVMFENVQCNKGVQVQPNITSAGTDPIRKVFTSTISKVKRNSKHLIRPKDRINQKRSNI
ncbi:uncharacterized protein LOC6613695 [Drosophila sechellia]|uniref:GD21915 n=2 Tax=melanogaster subgroup TaxID=32351 RepID=B4Q710_DROSI|nr:uncharacterized protein LOC6613695 [Drosophila sechellia]XP_002079633.1 uncharacterized protein LOC6732513 [Drosophila simulans]EDW54583.1 GM17904 [Drosophila sechellia]EDX05218.1 GD21915 [Drosophila simulans]KMY90508.1 uncharacterized protein Dsimw501_GD21915 [Drosophila simulans]